MAGQPDNREALMKGLSGDIESRSTESQRRHRLTPEQRKQEDVQKQLRKKPFGGSITDIERDAEEKQRRRRSEAARKLDSTQIVRGQANLGTPPENPDR